MVYMDPDVCPEAELMDKVKAFDGLRRAYEGSPGAKVADIPGGPAIHARNFGQLVGPLCGWQAPEGDGPPGYIGDAVVDASMRAFNLHAQRMQQATAGPGMFVQATSTALSSKMLQCAKAELGKGDFSPMAGYTTGGPKQRPHVRPFDVSFAPVQDLFSIDKLLIPFCVRSHWVLVEADFAGKRMVFYDSLPALGVSSSDCFDVVLNWLTFVRQQQQPVCAPLAARCNVAAFTRSVAPMPPQLPDSGDCGPLMLAAARDIFLGKAFPTFGGSDASRLRLALAAMLAERVPYYQKT